MQPQPLCRHFAQYIAQKILLTISSSKHRALPCMLTLPKTDEGICTTLFFFLLDKKRVRGQPADSVNDPLPM